MNKKERTYLQRQLLNIAIFQYCIIQLVHFFLVGEELSYDEHELLYECEFNYIFYKTKTVQMKRNEAKIS